MESSKQYTPPRIQALEKQVVDRIAAGEIVQRPASIAKELIENSLDADATTIDIHCAGGGLRLLSITDDGLGFHPADLPLAATRFATSKLVRFDDLNSIKTFGFRGEALASASMVGRLTIISRGRARENKRNECAYKLSYVDGKPVGKPSPSAGKGGTQVKVEDLFYNLQSRRRAFEGSTKENEEYFKILSVTQRYAVHCSKDGVGFVCRRKGGTTDLNTASLSTLKKIQNDRKEGKPQGNDDDNKGTGRHKLAESAMKVTIGHVFGSQLTKELLVLESAEGDIEAVAKIEIIEQSTTTTHTHTDQSIDSNQFNTNTSTSTSADTFAFKAFGLCTNGSYHGPKSCAAFILFINDRLVESGPICRAVEGIYLDILPRGTKPFIYLSIDLPGSQIDVNVHPTKREVAILHEDRLCSALADATKTLLRSAKVSKTFYAQALLPTVRESTIGKSKNKRKKIVLEENSATSKEYTQHKKKETHSKNLVRISSAAEKGSMEPFLSQKSLQSSHTTTVGASKSLTQGVFEFEHKSDCDFALSMNNIDMSKPGAFASICRCLIEQPGFASMAYSAPKSAIRPKKITPTECSYSSIEVLRRDITLRAHHELIAKLRDSVFVGCVSRHRSLLQSGIELLIVNHIELARELFYQLALTQFGGHETASLGNDGVDVGILLEKALQFEDAQCLSTSDEGIDKKTHTNHKKASKQMIECLASHAKMLNEYFSIRFDLKTHTCKATEQKLTLTGLPIILKGHSPAPHSLPMFLLRLATEVNWTEEKACFDGICTELGNYYAEIAEDTKEIDSEGLNQGEKKVVQHILFPAFRYYLVPPKEFASDGSFSKLALLSKLYKVFERC